jgi:predicted secreted protein
MSINAIEAQGVLIKIGSGSGSPETFTSIPELMSFSGPGGSASVIDVTDLQSTGKEKRMGLQDEGQLTLEINYIPDDATHAQLRTDRANRTLRNFQIIFTDASDTQFDFAAYVTGFSISGGVDGVITASVTLEISGSISES